MISMFRARPHPVLWKGLLAGAAGGLGGTLAMTAFQSLWTYLDHRWREEAESGADGGSSPRFESGEESGEGADEGASTTERAAAKLSQGFFGYELEERDRELAGNAVHFGFGTAVGTVYGAVAEYSPGIARGDGIPFGTGLMVVSDEIAVPAMGLARPPQEKPWSTHLYALCSHAVYGFALEAVRRSVRRAL